MIPTFLLLIGKNKIAFYTFNWNSIWLIQYILKMHYMKTKAVIAAVLLFSITACKKDTTTFTNNPDANDLHNKAVGYSANQLLGPGTYKSLKIEVQYMTGFAPDASALTQLQNFLSTYLNKPSGITIVTKEVSPSSSTTLSIDQVK